MTLKAPSRFCAECGAAIASGVSTVEASPQPRRPSTDPLEARFIPGTMLGDRYRVVSLVGHGGMGEVYRAEDLRLGQVVALKFLPEEVARDADRLARFHGEVRVARQISHPNVCRVYDIGEAAGRSFISMEYVDGEDLAVLLRRVGRLPAERAIRMARELCAGLAAAHDLGVLHRDLKPANVLVDGRGRARIADFGLAALVDAGPELRLAAGTPAYMSPEQRDGRGASIRSDLYALGLVLYELFTGRMAVDDGIDRSRSGSWRPASMTSLVSDVDPSVERVVFRCLEMDPAQRPASALAVAAALPGGDPLAAALAAGETPSPEMVAAAGEVGSLRPAIALGCLAAFLLALIPIPGLSERTSLNHYEKFQRAPLVLAEHARSMLATLGYREPPIDSAYGYDVDREYLERIANEDRSPNRWNVLTRRPSVVRFWYRQSPRTMVPLSDAVRVSHMDPLLEPGAIEVVTDPEGRLTSLVAVSPRTSEPATGDATRLWEALFSAAGLNTKDFAPVTPTWRPPGDSDVRAAWDGTYADKPATRLHVEAAALGGRPVYFELLRAGRASATSRPPEAPPPSPTSLVYAVVVLLLATHNLRLGRGDRRGASRLALAYGVSLLSASVLTAHDLAAVTNDLSRITLLAIVVWLGYVALEPYARRAWPGTMIGWSRLLAGRLRDPLVGRDVLLGSLAGLATAYVMLGSRLAPAAIGAPPTPPVWTTEATLLGGRLVLGAIADSVGSNISLGLVFFVLLFVLNLVLRWRGVATAIMLLFLAAVTAPNPVFFGALGHPVLQGAFGFALAGIIVLLLTRVGFLATIVCGFVSLTAGMRPVTLDATLPYSFSSYLVFGTLAAFAFYGFYTSLGGRTVFGPGFWQETPGQQA